MRTPSFRLVLLAASAALLLLGCPTDEDPHPIGASCSSAKQCESGICGASTCLDPVADDDGDGLVNGLEAALGSDPTRVDSDGDGLDDGKEVAADHSNVDTDGDGLPDIVESAALDPDGDCVTDQYDADNAVADSDLSPMRDVVCSRAGICTDQPLERFGVLCPKDVAVCDYTAVVGYEAVEVTCDGLDQNCDGTADEGFPDRDADGVADCVDDDWDNDTVEDEQDNCPFVANTTQLDQDADGLGDACAADHSLAFTTGPPSSAVAGAPFALVAAAYDANGAPAARFHGVVTVTLDAGDSAATLEGARTATAVEGVATFSGLTLTAPGEALTLTAASGDLTAATSAPFGAASGALDELRFTVAPAATTAGGTFSVTLTAYDAFGNVIDDFDGTVAFTSTDPAATLPPATPFIASDAGAHRFDGLALRTAGAQQITVTLGGEAVATLAVDVAPAAADHLGLGGAPAARVAGAPFALSVVVYDAFGNVATGYRGTLGVAATDAAAVLPAAHALTEEDAGAWAFTGVELRTAGSGVVITVADAASPSVTASATVDVQPAAAASLEAGGLPAATVAGDVHSVGVTLRDAYGNVATGGGPGAIALSLTDPQGLLDPESLTAAGGTATFDVLLATAGAQTVTLSEATLGSVVLTTTVSPAAASTLRVSDLPDPMTAGVPAGVAIRVEDAYGNLVHGFTGAVNVSTDAPTGTWSLQPGVVLLFPADGPAQATLTATFERAGAWDVDLVAADLPGAVGADTTVAHVLPAAPRDLVVFPATGDAGAGEPFDLLVEIHDAFGNTATAYDGVVSFSEPSDSGAMLPAAPDHSYGFVPQTDLGSRLFTATFFTAGSQSFSVSATDLDGAATATVARDVAPAAELGVLDVVASTAAAVAGESFTVTATPRDPYGNLLPTWTDPVTLGASAPRWEGPATGSLDGVTTFGPFALYDAGDHSVTVARAGDPPVTGAADVTILPGAPAAFAVTTQPTDGFVDVDLPTFSATVTDGWDNVVTDANVTLDLEIARHGGQGALTSQLSASAAGGVVAFDHVRLDAPGDGWALRLVDAAGQLASEQTDRFDVGWRAPSFTASPAVTGDGGCVQVDYAVAQPDGHPVDLRVEWASSADGPWHPAAGAPLHQEPAHGVSALPAAVGGSAHRFLWDSSSAAGRLDLDDVRLRLTASSGGGPATAAVTDPFDLRNGWRAEPKAELVTTLAGAPTDVAVGDVDGNGLLDVAVGLGPAGLVLFYQTAPDAFAEVALTDVGAVDTVRIVSLDWGDTRDGSRDLILLDRQAAALRVLTSVVSGVATVTFSSQTLYACSSDGGDDDPVDVVVLDLHRQGRPSLAVACAANQHIALLDDEGGFYHSGPLMAGGTPTRLAVADVARDGWPDLIVGHDGGVSVLNNTGGSLCDSDGECGAQHLATAPVSDVAAADLDRDGEVDVVLAHATATLTILPGGASDEGEWLRSEVLTLPAGVAATSVAVADLDHDGALDLVAGSQPDDAVALLRGTGGGSWLAARVLDAGLGSGPTGLAIADVSADGRRDVVAASGGASAPGWTALRGATRRSCAPPFAATANAPVTAHGHRAVPLHFDDDGKLDVLYLRDGSALPRGGFDVALGDGTGGFAPVPAAWDSYSFPAYIGAGDFNDDDLMDAVVSSGGTDLEIAFQDPASPGTFYSGYTDYPVVNEGFEVGDLDADGRDDFAFLGNTAVDMRFGADGDSVEELPSQDRVLLDWGDHASLGLGDLNHDGRLDFVFYNQALGAVCPVLSVPGQDRRWQPLDPDLCRPTPRVQGRVLIADLDGDDELELAFVAGDNVSTEPATLWLLEESAPSSGVFDQNLSLPACQGARGLFLGDFDGDARADLGVMCGTTAASVPGLELWLQGDDGSFGEGGMSTATLGPSYQHRRAHGAADLDGDGVDELLLDNLALRGAAGFAAPIEVYGAPAGTDLVALPDADGDGRLDLLVADDSRVILTRQDDALMFHPPETLLTTTNIVSLAAGDVDGDGRADFVVAHGLGQEQEVTVFAQTDSPGAFAPVESLQGSDFVTRVLLADQNGDGRDELLLVTSGDGGPRVELLLNDGAAHFQGVQDSILEMPFEVAGLALGELSDAPGQEIAIAGECNDGGCVIIAALGWCASGDTGGVPCLVGQQTLYEPDIRDLAVADLDRDGADDIVVQTVGAAGDASGAPDIPHLVAPPNDDTTQYAVFNQNPTAPGDFGTVTRVQPRRGTPAGLVVADVDDDGLLDLIGRFDPNEVVQSDRLGLGFEVLLNRSAGDGVALQPSTRTATAWLKRDGPFAVGDLDGDGRPDLAVGSYTTTTLRILTAR